MSFYVEVICDVGRMNNSGCWSFQNNNPQGRSLLGAAKEARKQGWKVDNRRAVCPDCQPKS